MIPEFVVRGPSRTFLLNHFKRERDYSHEETGAILDSLYRKNAISDPLSEATFYSMRHRQEAARLLSALEETLPGAFPKMVRTAKSDYVSTVWTEPEHDTDCEAIRPMPLFDFASFTPPERIVFFVIARLYIQSFDKKRSFPSGKPIERRLFSFGRHVQTKNIDGKTFKITGPLSYCFDRTLYVAVNDGVTGNAWLEMPNEVFTSYIPGGYFFNHEEYKMFIEENADLFRHFVSKVNEHRIPELDCLFVEAPETFEIISGQRHYEWKTSSLTRR